MERLQYIVTTRGRKMAGHILLSIERPAHTATYWVPEVGRRKMGSPKKTWRSTFKEDLEEMGVSGFAKKKQFKKSEITMEVGASLGIFFFFFKSSQNSPKPVLIFWSRTIPCHVFCL